jgi:hypothetical protein
MFKILQRTIPVTKKILCQNGSTIQKFKKGATQITEITYGANHKNASKIGLSKLKIEKTADGQKTFTSTFKNSKGDTLETTEKNRLYTIVLSLFSMKKGYNPDQIFFENKILHTISKLM